MNMEIIMLLLNPGKYKVYADDFCHKSEWYNEKDKFEEANLFLVEEDKITKGIDFKL